MTLLAAAEGDHVAMTNEDGANVQPASLTISAESLADAGLESQVRSWIGDGPNEAVTADQIVAVVGEVQLAQAAESLGREPANLAADLAARLPGLVDAAAPDGQTASAAGGGFPGFQVRWAPVPVQNLTSDLPLSAQIAPTSGLTLNDEVPIDGSVTLTVHYL
ncbi:YidB family protein [Streptomyces sp. NPDC057910]|uniref:YidB family protein n=1 Tax=Streptomyces sp. NPDC057910 TaxID=3346278 RepID=UPI0036F11B09